MSKKKDLNSTVLTARIDAALHKRVKSKLAKSGGSFQEIIENAVLYVDRHGTGKGTGTVPIKEGNQTNTSVKYNLHVVRQKSQKVVEIMGEIVSELDLASGENIVVPNTDLEKRISAATVEAEDAVAEFAESTAELEESIEKSRKPKRPDNRSVSGGAA